MNNIDNISLYKNFLFEIIEDKDKINKITKNEINNIPEKIKKFYEIEEKSTTGLEGIKAKKDALLSSLYYSFIALNYLNSEATNRKEILEQVTDMVTRYGGNILQFEQQYDELVTQYNESYLGAIQDHKELTDKDKTNHKFCVILADLLGITLDENERLGKAPLPMRISTGKEAVNYNRAAIKLNRQIELKQIEKYKNLLYSTFVSDAELTKTSSEIHYLVKRYEKIMKKNYPNLSHQELEYLDLLVRHHARNIGLHLEKIDIREGYPIIGIDEIKLHPLKWKTAHYELKYLFILNILNYDLLTTVMQLSPEHYSGYSNPILEKIEQIGDRLSLYVSTSPSIEEWEDALAMGLSLNAQHKFIKLDHSQKIGESPWIFDFISHKKTSSFYQDFLLEIKEDKKEISHNLNLRDQLSKCKKKDKIKALQEQLTHSNHILNGKFHTIETEELRQIEKELSSQNEILHFVLDGIEPYTHKKSPQGRGSGKWWSFALRGEHLTI